MNSLKRTCAKNLEKFQDNIQSIKNNNIKMDYEKILKMLRSDLEKVDTMYDVKIMDYRIIKTIKELDKIF